MAYPVAQGISITGIAGATSVTISESAPTIDTTDLASSGSKKFEAGLKDAAEVTVNHFGSVMQLGNISGGLTVGAISFTGATVMSSEASYKVGEAQSFTSTIRASN